LEDYFLYLKQLFYQSGCCFAFCFGEFPNKSRHWQISVYRKLLQMCADSEESVKPDSRLASLCRPGAELVVVWPASGPEGAAPFETRPDPQQILHPRSSVVCKWSKNETPCLLQSSL
jgi:hypothetical protein